MNREPPGAERSSLENRLPKRHGGSNPSSCAKNKQFTLAVDCFIFLRNERILTPFASTPCDANGVRIRPSGVYGKFFRVVRKNAVPLFSLQIDIEWGGFNKIP